MNQYIVGIDIGNGSVTAATYYCNQYITSLFFPKYATGKKNLNALDRGAVATYGIDPALNGNTTDLYVTRENNTYHLGLSAHTVDGAIIRETGFTRYSQVDHLQNMLLGSLKGLHNGGWRPERKCEIILGLGMPPKWYYDNATYNKAYDTIEEAFYGRTFKARVGDTLDVNEFTVSDMVVLSEAIGGYFDDIYDDNLFQVGDTSEGTLIIDIGYGTLDCAIIKDCKLGSTDELLTEERLGCHELFNRAVSSLGSRFNDFDELELLYHTGQSRLNIRQSELKNSISKQVVNYLSAVRSSVSRHYVHSRRGMFGKILIMGGITKIVAPEELLKAFNFDGIPVYIRDEFSNVRGYEKLIRDEANNF